MSVETGSIFTTKIFNRQSTFSKFQFQLFSAAVICKTVEEENLSIITSHKSYSLPKICKRIERNKIWTLIIWRKKTYRINSHIWPNDRPPSQRIIPFTKRNRENPSVILLVHVHKFFRTLLSTTSRSFSSTSENLKFLSSSQREETCHRRVRIASESRKQRGPVYFVTSKIHERRDQLGYRTPVGIFPFLGTFASISNRFSWPFLSREERRERFPEGVQATNTNSSRAPTHLSSPSESVRPR